MGPQGHFKIPGHSGTDFKHRKAFEKPKEYLKKRILSKNIYSGISSIKYNYNEGGHSKEKRKWRKGVLLVIKLFLIVALLSIVFMGVHIYKKPVLAFINCFG